MYQIMCEQGGAMPEGGVKSCVSKVSIMSEALSRLCGRAENADRGVKVMRRNLNVKKQGKEGPPDVIKETRVRQASERFIQYVR